MSFHEVRFPDTIAYGATGGPMFSTTVVETTAGFESRNSNWSASRGRWDVGSGVRGRADFEELIAFFRARRGRAFGFRFKDWTDFRAVNQQLGLGTGAQTAFPLLRRYVSGPAEFVRPIQKPVAGSVKVYLDDVEVLSGLTVDATTGVCTFSVAPALDVVVTADFEFDVPVRFDTDGMNLSVRTFELGEWSQIPIVEIRP